MINRRQMMAGAATGVLGAIAYRMAPSFALAQPLPDIDLAAPVVDIHCHIFNSADLPVYGFIKQSVFEVFDGQEQVGGPSVAPKCDQTGSQFPLSRLGLKFFAVVLDSAMSGAVTAKSEAAELARGIASAGPPPTSIETDLKTFFGPANALQAAGPDAPRAQRLLSTEFTPDELAAARKELANQIAADTGHDPLAAAGPKGAQDVMLSSGRESFTARHLNWAKRMAEPRAKHVEDISGLYSSKVRLYTPALIDYSKWLDDEPVAGSDLRSQVDVMEQIALRTLRANGAKFHGYIAFDPLRDVHENGKALELVTKAVTERGFLGAKLYPPMGFKPLGNANDPNLTFPKHALKATDGRQFTAATLASALDQRLGALYAWAAANGVPILAHAANSNGSGPCYGQRADTANWMPVIAGFRDIRICLAHLGSFDASRDAKGNLNPNDVSALERSWEWHFGRLITQGNATNLYADLSYFSELLTGDPTGMSALKVAFTKLINTFPAITDRLMYGSDWIMLDREAHKEEHLKAVYWFLSDVLTKAHPASANVKQMLTKIFSANAIRFLGLQPGAPAAGRLLAFYKKWDIPNADKLLDEFRLAP